MSQTDAENRYFPDELPDIFDNLGHWFRITRSIGKENAVRTHGKGLFSRKSRGNNSHIAAGGNQAAKDIELDAEIIRHNFVAKVCTVRMGVPLSKLP